MYQLAPSFLVKGISSTLEAGNSGAVAVGVVLVMTPSIMLQLVATQSS